MGLGDTVEMVLTKMGITKERVERWIGAPCGCKDRQDRLNRLGYWVRRVLTGKTEKAAEYLDSIMQE